MSPSQGKGGLTRKFKALKLRFLKRFDSNRTLAVLAGIALAWNTTWSTAAWALLPSKLLVVDDTRLELYAIAQVLSNHGLEIVTATDGEEALEIFLRSPQEYAAVVSDWQMPGLDGRELVMRLRSEGFSVPFYIRSANLDRRRDDYQELVRSFAQAGVDASFEKTDFTGVHQAVEDAKRISECSVLPLGTRSCSTDVRCSQKKVGTPGARP